VDPLAHTFTGAALAATGLRRATPLATAALIIGANAPDVDAVMMFAGNSAALAHRRGWTHGVLAMAVLPLLVTGLLLAWDRWVRRRRRPGVEPARAGPLLALGALGVATHPLLDWLNNYGMRWLMPFDSRWFYGDALFIIDPWVWLALGGVVFLGWSQRAASLAGWMVFWALASYLVLTNPQVPVPARVIWIAWLGALLAVRAAGSGGLRRRGVIEWPARIALIATGLYMGASLAANLPARAEVRAELAARGIGPVTDVMVGPAPANPLAGNVVAVTEEAYYLGAWRWLARPRFTLAAGSIRRMVDDPVYEAAARELQARRFLSWSRFPYAEIESDADGYLVRFRDARYAGRAVMINAPTVRLDRQLVPVRGAAKR
jgi:inner membrane protein